MVRQSATSAAAATTHRVGQRLSGGSEDFTTFVVLQVASDLDLRYIRCFCLLVLFSAMKLELLGSREFLATYAAEKCRRLFHCSSIARLPHDQALVRLGLSGLRWRSHLTCQIPMHAHSAETGRDP